MRFLLILSLLLLGARSFGQSTDLTIEDRSFIESHFRTAKKAESVQNYDTAAKEYSLILEKFPTALPPVHQNLGLVYYAGRKYERAIAAFEKGIRLEPDMVGAQLFLGSSYLLTAQPQKALPHLEFAHKKQSTVESATYLGQAYMAHLAFSRAADSFREALTNADQKDNLLYLVGKSYLKLAEQIGNSQSKLHPDSPHVQLAIAKIFESQKGYQVAAIKYLEAAELDPMNASIFFPLARMLAILGLDPASRLAVERYKQLMPNDRDASVDKNTPADQVAAIGTKVDFEGILRALPPVQDEQLPLVPMLSNRANAVLREALVSEPGSQWKTVITHLVEGRLKKASSVLPTIDTDNYEWLRDYLQASVQVWLGDFDKAGEFANRASLASSSSPMVQLLRAEIFHHLSLSYFGRLLKEYPDSCRAHFARAQNLAGQEKREAEAEFKLAIEKCPDKTQMRIALADHHLSNSRYKEALDLCLDELKLDPYSHPANVRIGRIYIQLRDPQKGMPFLRDALDLEPKSANARADLARGYELLGQWDKAIDAYKQALDADPSLNRIHYVLGRIYRRLGKKELADREYETFQANEAKEREQHVARIQKLRQREAGSEAR